MKTYTVGVVSAVVLMVVASLGIGIAQAAGTHSDAPVLSFEDQAGLEQGSSSSTYLENRPVTAFEDEMQVRGPIGTGSISPENDAGSPIVEVEGNMYREGADTGLP